jgi:uncharacterized membrane protein (UPF0127 family)
MRSILWFGGIVALFAAIAGFEFSHSGTLAVPARVSTPSDIITLDGASIHVTLARTPAEQEKGLGGRDSLLPDEGMLFVFPQDGQYTFWMKDMRFPIDIVWLSGDGRVVYIVPNLSPDTYPHSFAPSKPARYVLEVGAGFCTAHTVKIGDIARLP